MKRIPLVLLALALSVPALAEWQQVASENYDGRAVGRLEAGARLAAGRDGEAVQFGPTGRVVYPALRLPSEAGRIEMDLCPQEIMTPRTDRKHWMLLTDVGAGGAWPGATVIYFDRETCELSYGYFDGGWHWLCATGVEWTVGRWRQLAFTWGPQGRSIELDGEVIARDNCTQSLHPRTIQLGYFDDWSVAAPVLVDNLAVYGEVKDEVRTERAVVCPAPDGVLDTVSVTWSLTSDATAELGLYAEGREVARLMAPTQATAGEHVSDCTAGDAPSGRYELRLTARRADGAVKVAATPLSVDRELKWQPVQTKIGERFPLGVWYFWEEDASYIGQFVRDEAKAAAYYERTMADLHGIGVDTVIANWTPREHRRLMLDAAQRHGLRVIVHLDEVNSFIWDPGRFRTDDFVAKVREAVATAKDHPATVGYYLVDEPAPTPENIANIKLARQVVEALDPAHPGFSCLNTGWDVIFKAVGYPVLLVDIYPVYANRLKGDTLAGYLGALDFAHNCAEGKPLWLIDQCFGFKPRPGSIPVPNEVSLLCWEAIAHGAKGLIHFIYQSTTGVQGEWLRGIVDEELKPMDHRHEEVRRLHESLQPLRETLLGLERVEGFPISADHGFDVQSFRDGRGGRYLVVVNQDLEATRETTLRLAGLAGQPIVDMQDVATGARLGFSGGETRVELAPGTGKLLRLCTETP